MVLIVIYSAGLFSVLSLCFYFSIFLSTHVYLFFLSIAVVLVYFYHHQAITSAKGIFYTYTILVGYYLLFFFNISLLYFFFLVDFVWVYFALVI